MLTSELPFVVSVCAGRGGHIWWDLIRDKDPELARLIDNRVKSILELTGLIYGERLELIRLLV